MAAPKRKTFADAAESFIKHGGDGRYLPKLITYFGMKPLRKIFLFDVQQMALELYPHQKNSTRNRQAVSPTKAVLRHASDRGWCQPLSIRRFKEDPPIRKAPASQTWLHASVRQFESADRAWGQ